jgi:hypothetical protein
MKRLVLILALAPAAVAAEANVPDEVTKIEALKLGYALNGNSMVRWGSIDLSDRTLTPPPVVVRTIPITPPKKGRDK